MSVAWVLLAGGASSRLGQCKALADLGGGFCALDSLLEAGALLEERAVVVGAHAAAIRAQLPAGILCLENPAWESGRLSSVQCAVRALPGRDLCLAPVDVPLVPQSVVRSMLARWQAQGAPALGWLAPRERRSGRYGHPVLLGRELLAQVERAEPSRSLKDFRSLAHTLLEVSCESAAILDDLDSAEDLARLRQRRGFGLTL
jgi:molybdenum cofactor cytidylyltransferase